MGKFLSRRHFMKAVGVIVEYNPFHLGHKYHLQKARETSQADVVVAIMSGNFLQRGEPSILDKWQRAQTALLNGCDLVVELPVHYALQSADFFARGAITLLHALKVEALCFGTEVTNFPYETFGKTMLLKEEQIKEELEKLKHTGMSYPNQMRVVYEKLGLQGQFNQQTPNHLLGLTYAREQARISPEMSLLPIERLGQGYKDKGNNEGFLSGTSIREFAKEGDFEKIKGKVPKQTYTDLTTSSLVSWENYFPYLKYELLASSSEDLKKIYQMTEGLEKRLKLAKDAENFWQLETVLKTKRYSKVRLRRLLSYVLLQIKQEEMLAQEDFLNVLGFTKAGQSYLSEIKKTLDLPLITKRKKNQEELLRLNHRVDEIYALSPGVQDQIFARLPLRV